MKVATVRQRLAARLQEALACGDMEVICHVMDYVRAIGVALAPYEGDDEVDVEHLSVNSQQTARILGYHREHVRRLVRQYVIEGEKEGNQLRIPLTSVVEALESRVPSCAVP